MILSLVYICGNLTLTAGAVPTFNLPAKTFTFLGLTLIAFGGGGVKPCVAAFGGDQFKLPEQAKKLALFFSIYYFSINFGSFLSVIITPILRDDVKCFGDQDCFSLGFFVPACLMAGAFVVFVLGKPLYVLKPLEGNMIAKVSGCIWTAIGIKWNKDKTTEEKDHWLDYAEPKYGKKLTDETKILLNVLVLFVPLPFFWALFDQQGSRWTFQATRMEGDIGFYYIKPDQAQLLNPLMILIFIPLYEVAFYPLLNLVGVRRPLQKLTLGMILAGVAFVISSLLEWQLMKTYPILPTNGEAHVRIYNVFPCDYKIDEFGDDNFLNSMSVSKVMIKDDTILQNLKFESDTAGCTSFSKAIEFERNLAVAYYLSGDPSNPTITKFLDNPDKTNNGNPRLRVLANVQGQHTIELNGETNLKQPITNTEAFDLPKGSYTISINDKEIRQVDLKLGGVYSILVRQTNANNFEIELATVSHPNSLNILWIMPQYFVMTLGEVMFSVTGIQFSFDEAPESMKSVLNGCWQVTSAFGNLIIVIIAELPLGDDQVFTYNTHYNLSKIIPV